MRTKSSYNRVLKISAILAAVCAVILTAAIALPKTDLYAKYVTGGIGSDGARVAILDADAQSNLLTSYVAMEMYPNSDPYSVVIRAKNPGETAMRFVVTFSGTGNLPLLFTGSAPLKPTGEENTWYYEEAPGTDTPVNLPVAVSWDPSEKGYEYSGGVEMITVNVSAVQID